jgi:hypothetical protein
MENRDLNEHSDQDSSFSRSQDFSIPFSFPTLSLAFLALSNVCLGVKERIIARQRQLEARKTRRLKDMPKLISFFGYFVVLPTSQFLEGRIQDYLMKSPWNLECFF